MIHLLWTAAHLMFRVGVMLESVGHQATGPHTCWVSPVNPWVNSENLYPDRHRKNMQDLIWTQHRLNDVWHNSSLHLIHFLLEYSESRFQADYQMSRCVLPLLDTTCIFSDCNTLLSFRWRFNIWECRRIFQDGSSKREEKQMSGWKPNHLSWNILK